MEFREVGPGEKIFLALFLYIGIPIMAAITLAEKVDEATEEAFYNYVFGSGNYEPRDADALGTAVAKYVMDDVIISIIDDYDHVYECDVENTKGEVTKVYCDDEGH